MIRLQKVREYYETPSIPSPISGQDWLLRPEIPSSAEIMDREDISNPSMSSDVVEIYANKPHGAFASREEYLQTHYELLREDSLRPLREAVTAVRRAPTADEEAHNGQIGIYEKVTLLTLRPLTMLTLSRSTSVALPCPREALQLESHLVCAALASKLPGSSPSA